MSIAAPYGADVNSLCERNAELQLSKTSDFSRGITLHWLLQVNHFPLLRAGVRNLGRICPQKWVKLLKIQIESLFVLVSGVDYLVELEELFCRRLRQFKLYCKAYSWHRFFCQSQFHNKIKERGCADNNWEKTGSKQSKIGGHCWWRRKD
jgi:hypothetical protein